MALSESDIEYSLLALYRRGGSYKETEEYLRTTYLKDEAPDAARLKRWRTGIHRDKYLKLAQANAEDLEKEIIVRLREVTTQTGLLQIEALEHLTTRIKSGDVTPTMIKELSVISGVSIDKLLVLSGRPDSITQIQNPDLIIKRLVEAGYADVIEGTATELTPEIEEHLLDNAHVRAQERSGTANQRSRTGTTKHSKRKGLVPGPYGPDTTPETT